MKPKILIFSLAYYPKHIGGAEVAIKEITDRLGDEYEFHLICNRYDSTLPKTEKIGSVHIHRIGIVTKSPTMGDLRSFPLHLNKVLYQFLSVSVAKKLHRQHSFDGIWAMMAHATGIPAGAFKKKFPDVPYVLTLQEGDPPKEIEQKMKIFGSAFDEAFSQADVIQVISNFLGDWAKQKNFTGPVIRIPNAVDTEQFSKIIDGEKRSEIRQALTVSDSDTLLVTTSRLVNKNAVDDVIRAVALLPETVKFVIYGTGPDEASLRDLALEKGVNERVFFEGHIDHSVMPEHLKACDIFIRPSRSEGMGNSFIEAMAAELPVIGTQEGGIADFLFSASRNPDKETTGWSVDTDSPEQIKEAVEEILDDPAAAAAVVQRARAMVMKSYDWDLIATNMRNQVFSIIKK